MPRTVEVCRSREELAARASEHIAASARAAVVERGRFTVALSGGDTPGATYSRLAADHGDTMPWEDVHVFWGDERCIPLERPDNHFTLATKTLLSRVPIPGSNVHRARGEADDPAEAAAEYEQELRRCFIGELPDFDLVILGMGEDGHVASLFPGSPGYAERERLVVDHWVTKRGERVRRLTLTLPVITAARQVLLLVSGALKADMLAHVLGSGSDLPARRVDQESRDVVWMVDREAASAAAGLPDSARCPA